MTTRALRHPSIWLVMLVLSLYGQSYRDRQRNVDNQRAQCEGAKAAQTDEAIAWSVAAAQRRRDGDAGTAAAYSTSSESLWRRAARDCRRAYPNSSLLP